MATAYTATYDTIYDPANTVDVPDITHMAMDVADGGKADGGERPDIFRQRDGLAAMEID